MLLNFKLENIEKMVSDSFGEGCGFNSAACGISKNVFRNEEEC
jgi:hypothetical protein